jgi:hypothetical protein
MIAHAICFGVFAAVLILIYGLVILPLRKRVADLESGEARDTVPSLVHRPQSWTLRIECKIGRSE